MKILLCGSKGQLGVAVKKFCPKNFLLFDKSKQELDICNLSKLKKCINLINPDIIINAAAYTAVDDAEKNTIIAKKINYQGPYNLAQISNEKKIKIIHISTDYVFDGFSKYPYTEEDSPNPLSYYGKTKLMGEKALKDNCEKYLIFRVSWLYGPYNKNFLTKILKAGVKNKKISVVSDQISIPTSTFEFSKFLWKVCEKSIQDSSNDGLYHYSGSGSSISRYDFVKTIFSYSNKFGYKSPLIMPILSEDFESIAIRPKYSCLNINKALKTFNFTNKNWKDSLKEILEEIFQNK